MRRVVPTGGLRGPARPRVHPSLSSALTTSRLPLHLGGSHLQLWTPAPTKSSLPLTPTTQTRSTPSTHLWWKRQTPEQRVRLHARCWQACRHSGAASWPSNQWLAVAQDFGPSHLAAPNIATAQPACPPAELLVELPLAYYVAPVSRVPGQLAVQLDFERTRSVAMCCSSPQPSRSALPPAAPPLHLLCRMNEDGQCSLRLRVPCEWEGAVYEAVTAVQPMPLLSGDWGGWWPMPPRGC